MANNIVIFDQGKTRVAETINGLTPTNNIDGNWQVGLYTAVSGGLSAATVNGDITEPTFTGYAKDYFTGPVVGAINASDYAPVMYDPVQFQPTAGSGLPQTALGAIIYDSSDGLAIGGWPFSSGFVFSSTSSLASFVPELDFGQL